MALHNQYGADAEELACQYLQQRGYYILDRNWRSGHKEIDIVALKDNELVIVEVKARKTDYFGNPEEAVTIQKIRRTVAATDAYVRYHRFDYHIRFDVIAITGVAPNVQIRHIEDAFRAPLYAR